MNLFDTSEWIAARTITVCECVAPPWLWVWSETDNARQAISDLSFSHDGEYLAIAGADNCVDIVRAIFYLFVWDLCARDFSRSDVASLKLCHCVLRTDEATRGWIGAGYCDQTFWPGPVVVR